MESQAFTRAKHLMSHGVVLCTRFVVYHDDNPPHHGCNCAKELFICSIPFDAYQILQICITQETIEPDIATAETSH